MSISISTTEYKEQIQMIFKSNIKDIDKWELAISKMISE